MEIEGSHSLGTIDVGLERLILPFKVCRGHQQPYLSVG